MDTIVTVSMGNYVDKDWKVTNANGMVGCYIKTLGIHLTVNMKDLVEI
ncbi:MAG: hypothetical protein ACRDCW_02880 [Sarcina sp.]